MNILSKNIVLSLAVILFSAVLTPGANSAFAEGFDAQLELEGQALYLNGEGPRKKAFITIYDTALYLTEKGSDGRAIIDADHAMSVGLIVRSRFATASRISEAFREGLENASPDSAAIEPQIQAFLAVFEQGVVKEDAFDFLYIPQQGMRIYKNDVLMASIEGMAFKKALFSIWLAEQPVSETLKSQLLGQ